MKNCIIPIIIILMVLSCTCSSNKNITNSFSDTKFSLQLQHTIDSLMTYVDCLDSLEYSYCTLIIDSTASGKTLRILIGIDPVFRIHISPQNDRLKIYGGVGLKKDSNHIILMDSMTFNVLKPQINDTLYVEDIYKGSMERYSSDYRPHMWRFELLFDSNGIFGIREL